MFHRQKFRNPVPVIRNPPRGIQNPRLSWIPLHCRRRFFKKLVLYRPYRRFPAAPLQLILYSSEQALWGALAAGGKKKEKSDSSVHGEPQGRWNSNSRDVVAITSSPSFSRPAARAPRRAYSQAINFAPHNRIPRLQERLGLNCSPRSQQIFGFSGAVSSHTHASLRSWRYCVVVE